MLTTVASRVAMPDPRTDAAITHRPREVPYWSAAPSTSGLLNAAMGSTTSSGHECDGAGGAPSTSKINSSG